MKKIGVYGYGRIGHLFVKIALDKSLFVLAAVADVKELKTLSALFSVDTNYGHWKKTVSTSDQAFVFDGNTITYVNSVAGVPNWDEFGIELIMNGLLQQTSGSSCIHCNKI